MTGVVFIDYDDCMKTIPVGKKHFAIVDDEDYDDLVQFQWLLYNRKRNKTQYTFRKWPKLDGLGVHTEYMHKRITGFKQTDHINGNGLDNQRKNLRNCDDQQNRRNTNKQRGDYTSQYKGVCLDKRSGKWKSYITIDKVTKSLGNFSNEIDAARAYNQAALKLFGAFANINPLP